GAAWITLVIAPMLILLVFQFSFLPYHSHLATWTHRLLLVMEMVAVFSLWPLVLDARRKPGAPESRIRFAQAALALAPALLLIAISVSIATFPGEPHVNVATGHPW